MIAGASFRDPSGTCCLVNGRILRALTPEGSTVLDAFLATRTAREFSARNRLVQTRRLDSGETAGAGAAGFSAYLVNAPGSSVYEHERIAFASYPYEWP